MESSPQRSERKPVIVAVDDVRKLLEYATRLRTGSTESADPDKDLMVCIITAKFILASLKKGKTEVALGGDRRKVLDAARVDVIPPTEPISTSGADLAEAWRKRPRTGLLRFLRRDSPEAAPEPGNV